MGISIELFSKSEPLEGLKPRWLRTSEGNINGLGFQCPSCGSKCTVEVHWSDTDALHYKQYLEAGANLEFNNLKVPSVVGFSPKCQFIGALDHGLVRWTPPA